MNNILLHLLGGIHYNRYIFKSVDMQTKRVCAIGSGSCHIGVVVVWEYKIVRYLNSIIQIVDIATLSHSLWWLDIYKVWKL